VNRLLVVTIAVLALAVPLFAAPVSIDPPNPDSNTPITIWLGGTWQDNCPVADPVVTMNGTNIFIEMHVTARLCPGSGLFLTPVWSQSVKVAPLPAGTYSIHATILQSGVNVTPPPPLVPAGDLTFSVTDANPPFTIFPNAVSIAGGDLVIIAPSNAQSAVSIGGLPATPQLGVDNVLRFKVPPHAAGTVDVSVNQATAKNAFHYFDSKGAPDESAFETVLVPMFYRGPGAFGSQWSTDLFIRNESSIPVLSYRPLYFIGCNLTLDFCPQPIPPGAITQIQPVPSLPTNGLIYRPLRQQSNTTWFSARVRDSSHEADDFGSELPIVHERSLRRGRLVLPDVVVDPRYRTTLRLYSVDDLSAFRIDVRSNEAFAGTVFLTPTKGPGDEPWIASTDLGSIAGTGRYTVEVTAGPGNARIWAVASVTNNVTQHVTLVTPQ
jgi:hypothetical protein